ncbi:hypothetical protein CCACVL1_01847, partial [Corchorus capsularis]
MDKLLKKKVMLFWRSSGLLRSGYFISLELSKFFTYFFFPF